MRNVRYERGGIVHRSLSIKRYHHLCPSFPLSLTSLGNPFSARVQFIPAHGGVEESLAAARRRNDSTRKFAVLSEIHTRDGSARARTRKLDELCTDRQPSRAAALRFDDESWGNDHVSLAKIINHRETAISKRSPRSFWFILQLI